MTVATPADIEVSLMRELTEQEQEYAGRLLARAENLIRARVPNLDNLCDTDSNFAENVAQIEAEAVARVYRAQEAGSGIYSSESEDGYTYKLNYKVASGLLYITDDEYRRISRRYGFRTIAPLISPEVLNHYYMTKEEAFTRDLIGGDY